MTKIVLSKLSGEDKKARIGKILILVGDHIKPGDGLFNAESSKGNFLVKSEYDGIVKKIYIQEGTQIELGQEIVEIEGEKVLSPQKEEKSFKLKKRKVYPEKLN